MNTHRVAVMEMTQVIMDIEADNDLDSIKKRALEAYFNEEGDPERGLSFPAQVLVYPWLEEGQLPPAGSNYPSLTVLDISGEDLDKVSISECGDHECECGAQNAQVIPFPNRE